MRKGLFIITLVGLLFTVGCICGPAGSASYRRVDTKRDLDRTTLARYRAEAAEAARAGQTGHMLVLEHSNWWPLGLLAFWHRGAVQALPAPQGGTYYMVSQSRGYGPLSVLYVSQQDATFRDDGSRFSTMDTSSILWGHLVMTHEMESEDKGGHWESHEMTSLIHHFINWGQMEHEFFFSLFSAPNPVGFGN